MSPGRSNSLKLTRVELGPAARTNWHVHGGVQILFIMAGRCRFQHAEGPVGEAEAGETIYIPAAETHWRGTTPEERMVYTAMNFVPEAESLEPVSAE